MSRFEQARLRSLTMSAVAVFVAAALVGKAHAATLTVGPVEQVNLKSSTLVVLGQVYHIGPSVSVRNQAGAVISLGSLAPDTVVSVDGTETAAGKAIIKSVTALPQLDVPGATPLMVTGVVSQVTPIGQIKIGNLIVDVNATLTSDSQQVTTGELVEIAGTQPTGGGLFLAQSAVSLTGVGGSGFRSKAAIGVGGSGFKSSTAIGVGGSGFTTNAAIGVGGSGFTTNAAIGVGGSGFRSKAAIGVGGSGFTTNAAIGVGGSGFKSSTAIGVGGSGFKSKAAIGVGGSGLK